MATVILESTLDQAELAAAAISENETETIPSLSVESSELTGSNAAMQPTMDAHQSFKFFERALTAVIASMGLAVYVAAPPAPSHATLRHPHSSAYQSHRVVSLVKQPQSLSEQATADLISHSSEAASEVSDGIYLYGQSQTPFEIGHEYLVFEVNGDEIIGASYFPYSEFVCFAGKLEENHVSILRVSPSQSELTSQPDNIELQPVRVAGTDDLTTVGFIAEAIAFPPINLADYHAITGVSQMDLQILNHCQQIHQA